MRISLNRGKRRQEWEINHLDYRDKRPAVNVLLEYVGLPATDHRGR